MPRHCCPNTLPNFDSSWLLRLLSSVEIAFCHPLCNSLPHSVPHQSPSPAQKWSCFRFQREHHHIIPERNHKPDCVSLAFQHHITSTPHSLTVRTQPVARLVLADVVFEPSVRISHARLQFRWEPARTEHVVHILHSRSAPIPTVHDPSKYHFVGQTYASVQSLPSVSTGSVGFVKCTFNNFKSTTSGSGISIGIHASSINCPFVISECNFVNFTSSGNSNSRGAVTIACTSGSSPSVLVQKSKFENCSVSGETSHAAALRINTCPSPTVSSCNVTSCSAGEYAGGVHLDTIHTLATVSDCRFSDCSAGSWGGGLRVFYDSSYEVSNTLFERCHADSNGGAIDSSNGISSASFVLCRFETCTAVNSGGGAFTFNVDNCTFDSCSCGKYGAAMGLFEYTSNQKAKCTFKKVVFIKCQSDVDGGAMVVKDCHSAKIEDCVVQECSTKEVGGVRFYNITSSTVHSTLFTNCSAGSAHGGAGFAHTAGTDLTVTNTNFTKMRSERLGGAIRMWTIETIKFEDCRFVDCVAEEEGGAGAFYFPEIVATRTITLTRVTILDCHSTSSHTGGIYFNLAGNVDVSACTVEGSSCAVYGGGLRVQFAHSLTLSDSNFSSNEAGSSGGSVDTSTIEFVEVKNCSFSDSTAVTSGGGLVLTRHSTATVSNCTFLSCHSRSGGAMYVNYPTTSVTLSRIVMKKCGADYVGGGLYCLDLETATATLSVSEMDFGKKGEGEENTCGELGADVFLLFVDSMDIAAISDWSECLFSSSPADGIAFTRDERLSAAFGVRETEVVLHHSILAEVHPFDDTTMFVDGQNGLDESKCGLSTIPCATLSRGMEGVSDEGKIAIRTEADITELMTLDKSVVWESTGGDRARVVLAEAGSVSVESHSLALAGLAFSAQPSSSTRARAVVTVQSGALTVHSCTFEGIHSSSSGSCIKAMLISTDSLTITETAFHSCTSTADGGALHVTVDGGTFSTSGTITFEGCSATGNGNCLSLSSADLVSLLKVGTLISIKPSLPENNTLFTSTQKEQFFGYQSSTSKGSLLHYWYPRTSNVFRVNSEGDEHPLCGIASLPCASLEYAHDSLAQSESELILTSDIQLTSQLDAKFETETIKCEEYLKTTLSIQSTGSVSVGSSTRKNVDFILTFSAVSFMFDTSPRSSPFLHVSGGVLVFTACTFGISTTTTALPNILILTDGGTLTMTASTIQNMSSSSSLLSLTGGQTTLTTLDTKSIVLTSTTLISLNGADLTMASSTFNTITNTLGDGSILSATVPSGNTVTIEDGSATSCSTTGNGGAIFVRLAGNGKFEMKGTSGMIGSRHDRKWELCLLWARWGCRQFLFRESSIPIVSPENPAPFLFVESDDLTTSITTTRFNFLLPFTFDEADYTKYHGILTSEYTIHQSLVPYLNKLTEAYLSTTGNDNQKCGDTILPCESLSKALAWLIADHTDTESLPHYQVLLMNHGIHNTTIDMEEYILSVTTNKTLGTQNLIATGSSFILGDGATGDTSLSLSNMHLKWTGAAGTFLDQSKGTVLLSACSFVIDDSATLFSSSALIVKGGTLAISELTLDCNTLSTSPLLEMSGGAAGISDVHISNAQLASSLFTGSGDLTIQSSSFSSLSSSSSSSILFTLSTSSHKLHIGSAEKPVEFTSCSSSTNGGALNVAITFGGLKITDTTFKKCSSSLNGGAIFVDLTSLSSPGSYSLSSVTFATVAGDLNSCGQSGKGSDLFISVASGQTSLISSASLTGSYFTTPSGGSSSTFTSSEMSKYEFSEIDGSSGSILYLLHPYTGGQLFVNSESAADNALCGHSYLACQTLPLGHSSSKDSSDGKEATVFLSASVTLFEAFSSSKTVKWTSDQSSKQTVTLTTDSTIKIPSKLLSLSHLVLTISAEQYSQSFFTVNGGSLSVSDCEFKSIASSASGSAISATLGTGTSLSITTVTFTSCTSTADGGALHVTVNGGTFSTSGTITFEGCSATGNGKYLSLSSSDLVSLLKVGTLNSIKPSLPENNVLFTTTQKERFFGFESASSSGSLSYYWYPHTTSETSTHIHSSGEDHPFCGVKSLPCQSISTALSHANSRNTFPIDSALTLSETIAVTQTATLTSSSSTAITVSSDGIIIVTANELTLSNLAFTGPATSTSQSFVTVSSTGSLSVCSCSFTSFSSLTNGGALNVALTTGSLSITDTTFKKCSSSLTGGALGIVLSGTATLRISQGSFSGCRAGGDGGALHVTCSSSMDPSAVTIDADFEDCASGSGKGNWMLLSGFGLQTLVSGSVWSIRPTLPLSYLSGSALSDLWGMDKAEGTPLGYDEVSLWVYLVGYSWSVVWVGSDGRDVVGCGREGWKCQTIWTGASQLLGTTAEQIVVGSSTDLDRVVMFDSQDIEICGNTSRQLVRISSEGGIAVSSHDATLRCLDVDGGDTQDFEDVVLVVLAAVVFIRKSIDFIKYIGSGSVCSGSYGDGKKIEICGTEIVSCSSSGDGGAVGVALSGTATLRISQTSFSECRAGGRGGAIFVDFTEISSAQQYALLQLTFGVGLEANAAGVGKKGNDVFVVGSHFDRMILPSRWLGSFEKAEAEDFFGKDGDKEAESLLRFLLMQEVWVGKGGNDETGTGSDSMPFLSLGKGLTRIVERGEELNTVSVLEEARIGGCVVVGKETGTAQTIRISSTEWKGGKIVCEVEGGSVGGGRWKERRRMIAIKRSLVIVSSLTFELRGTSKQIVSVFAVSDNAELSLAECWLTTREVVKTSFVEVGSTGSLTVSDVSCSEGRFGGKGSVVVCVGSGRVEMREVEMTSCSFEGGGVVVGGSTRGILIGNSLFRNCSGGSFGSLIRISVFGCSAEVQNCVFEGCVTRLRMDEIADVGRAVGGGCVVIEMSHRRSSTRSAPHTSADLSMSSFVSCVLINTSPHPSSPRNVDFVGGSGFLIFVSDAGEHVDLRKVRVVDSVCEKMEGWGKRGFEGGVVVWRGQSLRLNRREMEVKGSSVGSVKI
ncbi:putative trimeric autotransporter adhesin [Blattamonas nauphoetae]|uniref:Trimeric autotransporter adhesin n=1 Tax=Blattamonas nauphoetae TaxID=2049346 RepID=A0ABQ9XAA1_9EUKA|nr:putative trimeric autotransporter adhesin [Blattamonas nauphoetae]